MLPQRTMMAVAMHIAPRHPGLWEDMAQEGYLRLLQARPASSNVDAYERQVARNGMIDFLRKEFKGRVVSFATAKRQGLVRCPACNANDIAWTIYWPGAVRCRSCLEMFCMEA